MGQLTQSDRRALDALRTLFHREWDPIGGGVAEDAYDGYALHTLDRLIHGACVEEIAAYLDEVEIRWTGLSLTPQASTRNREVASLAAALVDASRRRKPPAARPTL